MNSIIKKLVDIVLLAVFAFGLTTCKKETIAPPKVRLFGDGPSSINITSAGVSAEVIDQGGAEVISRGFAYGLSGGAMDTVFCGSGTGPFSTNLSNLQPNTPYVYEAFAKNAGGPGTSGKVSFTTKDKMKPTVKTGKQVSVTTTTATIGDNKIMDEGGDPIIERGVRYGTDSTQLTKSVPAIEDVDVFTCRLTDLTPNTTYYYQAYAKNSKGPGYGLKEHFTANPLPAINLIVSATPPVIAQGGSSRLKVEPSGGNGSFTYQWDHASSLDYNNIQNPTATPTTTTTYTCTVTSGNQTANGSCTVTVVCKPTGLTATTSGNNVNLTWTAPNSALSYKYNVYRNNTLIKSGLTTTTYPDSNLGAGTYNYQVTAVYNNVESPKSNMASATINSSLSVTATASPNTIPNGSSSTLSATATGGNGSYTYSWTPTTGLSNSHVQSPTASPSTTTTYTVTVSSNGQTAMASVTVNVVRAPTNLTANVQNTNQVRLTWTAPNTVTSYKVYRNNTLIKSGLTTTTYTDSNLGAGTYSYQVTAVYNNVESQPSNTVQAIITPQVPSGAISGVFSVEPTTYVYFSQGNLQYQASTQTWRFAAHQYDVIGSANSDISQNNPGWIDLFGWGTSGWNCGNTYYRPWNSANLGGSLYGPPGFNLTGSYANSDWGWYNAISNGGNQAGVWRTLTQSEWNYVFNQRNTASGKRYAKAQVNGVNGVILLPDDWNTSYYSLSNYNTSDASYSSNVINSSSWTNLLEAHGCVFLPAAGYRDGTLVSNVGSRGEYWSASWDIYSHGELAYRVYFNDGNLLTDSEGARYWGQSVRLVRSAQ